MEWLCFIGVWFLCGMIAASIYQRKGRSGITGFLGGFLLGPLGVILALASGSNLQNVLSVQSEYNRKPRFVLIAKEIYQSILINKKQKVFLYNQNYF
jgi:uncharacterized membrane protein YeaQ/YmgE (transglycosylase-associated protein family)